MSTYNGDQREALLVVRRHLSSLPDRGREELLERVRPYLEFRSRVGRFQEDHLGALCTGKCFTSGTSACCGREGIITFFADVVVNALLSTDGEARLLLETLDLDRGGANCVYLGERGCLWRLKPIVCEMFLCDFARDTVLGAQGALRDSWEALRGEERIYTRPDRPVLFDDLERLFIDAGVESPLMYFHTSPGLLRLKARHGVGRGSTKPQPG